MLNWETFRGADAYEILEHWVVEKEEVHGAALKDTWNPSRHRWRGRRGRSLYAELRGGNEQGRLTAGKSM